MIFQHTLLQPNHFSTVTHTHTHIHILSLTRPLIYHGLPTRVLAALLGSDGLSGGPQPHQRCAQPLLHLARRRTDFTAAQQRVACSTHRRFHRQPHLHDCPAAVLERACGRATAHCETTGVGTEEPEPTHTDRHTACRDRLLFAPNVSGGITRTSRDVISKHHATTRADVALRSPPPSVGWARAPARVWTRAMVVIATRFPGVDGGGLHHPPRRYWSNRSRDVPSREVFNIYFFCLATRWTGQCHTLPLPNCSRAFHRQSFSFINGPRFITARASTHTHTHARAPPSILSYEFFSKHGIYSTLCVRVCRCVLCILAAARALLSLACAALSFMVCRGDVACGSHA